MAMPASARRRWTRAEVIALNDASPETGPRYELVEGELLVTASPIAPHQRAVRRLLVALETFLAINPLGEAFSDLDVQLEEEGTIRPDVLVVPPHEAIRLDTEMPARDLLLVVEVLSPSTAYADRGPKRLLYQRHVPEYWIVDLDARLVERWRPGEDRPKVLRERIEWLPYGVSAPLVLEVAELFAIR
jgi:Uma2 family endonuclease